jgi:hypothetical protein
MAAIPDKLRCGASVVYMLLPSLARDWGCTEEALRQFLGDFQIPIVKHCNGGSYVSLFPLEAVLFYQGMPPGWSADTAGLPTTYMELAGLLYGAVTRDVIVKRVKALVREMKRTGT